MHRARRLRAAGSTATRVLRRLENQGVLDRRNEKS